MGRGFKGHRTVTLDQLEAAIGEIVLEYSEEKREQTKQVTKKYAVEMEQKVKANTNLGPGENGHARDSWTQEFLDKGYIASARIFTKGKKAHVAYFQEYGTYKDSPKGWATKAYYEVAPAYLKAITNIYNK